MFTKCFALKILELPNFDTPTVENMGSMFEGCSKLETLDLSGWDTSKVTNMRCMFFGCSALKQLNLSGKWNTSSVTNMERMFDNCKNLTSLNLSNFDTSNVTGMRSMFYGCTGLTSLDLSNWDTSKVADADEMFKECSSLKWVTLKQGWQFPFASCGLPEQMYVKNGNGSFAEYAGPFPTPKTDTYYTENPKAFAVIYDDGNGGRAAKLYKRYDVPVVGNVFEGDTVTDVITGIENMPGAFKDNGGKKLTKVVVVDDGIQPLTMKDWFYNCQGLVSADLGKLDPSKTEDMSSMFSSCSSLTELDLSGWNADPSEGSQTAKSTKNVKNMAGMFYQCFKLSTLDLSGLDTSSVKNVRRMFAECGSLKQVTLRERWRFSFADCSLPATMYVKDGDGSFAEYRGGFPTPKTDTYHTEKLTPKAFAVIYHDGNNQKAAKLYKRGGVPKPGDIFDGVKVDAVKESIEESEDLFAESSSESDRLTSVGVADDGIQPLNMSGWFNGCSNLVNVDLGRLDTSKVSNMGYLFDGCGSLTSDGISSISNWNTGNVTNMANVFNGCLSLTSLDLSKWNTEKVRIIGAAFATCKNLTSLDLSGWNTKVMSSSGFSTSRVFVDCNKLDSITLGQNWNLNLYECGISTSVKFYDRDTGEVYNPKNAITKTVVYTTIKPATVSQSSIDQLEKDAAPADVSSGVAPRKSVDVELISDQASNAVVNDDASSVVMPSSEDARHVGDALVEESDSGSPAENSDAVDTGNQDDRHKAIGVQLK